MNNIFFVILCLISFVTAYGEDDVEGFRLKPEAEKHLGVSFKTLKSSGPYWVPQTALIHIKHSTGVYRRWEKHITMVLVKVLKRKKGEVLIRSVDLQAGDEVAISGVPFLRMTEADLNSETIDYCSH
jgi:hypothetical protein